VWQLQTGGDKSSINAIRNTFDEIKEMAGTVVNIPFDLVVKKVTSNKPEAKSVYPVISLVPNISSENMEVLRKFFEAGLDIKKEGMLNEQKLTALQEHATVEIKALEETVDDIKDHQEQYRGVISGNADEVINEVKHAADLKKKGTALDAASNTVVSKFEAAVNEAASGVSHEQDVAAQIKRCKTVEDLQQLFSIEPSLFMEEENSPLNVQWMDRMADLKAKANG
jgi:hypothetical protein